MKHLLAYLIAALMLLGILATAEVGSSEALVVGTATEMSGCFFTAMWGNDSSDVDVRLLLHGCSPVMWNGTSQRYEVDRSVVRALEVRHNSDGSRSYEIALQAGLRYSDGTPITAQDYAFSILLSLAPAVAEIGGHTSDSDFILGAREYRTGRSQALWGLRLIDDDHFCVTIRADALPYFHELALLDYNPYPIQVIAPGCSVTDCGEGAQIAGPFDAELLQRTILDAETGYLSHPDPVSGPYKMLRYDADTQTAEFERNPMYPGSGPRIARILLRAIAPAEMADALARGEVDLLSRVTNGDAIAACQRVAARAGIRSERYARSGLGLISFCCERATVHSAAVRKAIAHCLDRAALAEACTGDRTDVVAGCWGRGQWMYRCSSSSSLATIPNCDLDVRTAIALLEMEGWTLNRSGETFDSTRDSVRCKHIDGKLIALELRMIYPEGSTFADALRAAFAEHLARAGIQLHAEAVPMADLLRQYHHTTDRDVDMIFLGLNFAPDYNPAPDCAPGGPLNPSKIANEALYRRALDLCQTEPGDAKSYCKKWLAFQRCLMELMPVIPVYSNEYCDFYTERLHDYEVSTNISWARAILSARLLPASDK